MPFTWLTNIFEKGGSCDPRDESVPLHLHFPVQEFRDTLQLEARWLITGRQETCYELMFLCSRVTS